MRREFTMTKQQLDAILAACKPVPYMVVGGFAPRSQQENANDAWAKLGLEMGFDHMSVWPVEGKGMEVFTAEVVELEPQKDPAPLGLEMSQLKAMIKELQTADPVSDLSDEQTPTEAIVIKDLTDRELEVAWHVMCEFAQWIYTFPYPSQVDGLSDEQLKLYNEGAASRHEVFEIIADLLIKRMAETRSIRR